MIRNAVRADIPALIELGHQMHQESIFAQFEYNEQKLAELICTLIQSTRGIALVSEVDGTLNGGFLGAVHEHFFGTDFQATDYALFLAPEARNSTIGVRLIKEYIV